MEELKTGCQAAPGPPDMPEEDPYEEDQAKKLPTETRVDTLQPEDEPKTRAEFLKYSCDITWIQTQQARVCYCLRGTEKQQE